MRVWNESVECAGGRENPLSVKCGVWLLEPGGETNPLGVECGVWVWEPRAEKSSECQARSVDVGRGGPGASSEWSVGCGRWVWLVHGLGMLWESGHVLQVRTSMCGV